MLLHLLVAMNAHSWLSDRGRRVQILFIFVNESFVKCLSVVNVLLVGIVESDAIRCVLCLRVINGCSGGLRVLVLRHAKTSVF